MNRSLLAIGVVFCLVGCTTTQSNPSPDQIRRDAAKATSTAVRDVTAAAKGVADGLKQKGALNLNTASMGDLETLPGIDDARAQKIIDRRPYDTSDDLVKKHVLSKAEYDRIADKVTTQ
jgi:DNA uptake protein ComE-like DNA-binding protein